MRTSLAVTLTLVLVVSGWSDDGDQRLVVHEWGTFTVLQDDAGDAVEGVNINEETLPPFVHKLAADLTPDSHELAPLIGLGYVQPRGSKGIRRYFQAARMRMETPIIYLYPPKGQPARPIDVQVNFNGGWITEWYPNAEVVAPGYRQNETRLPTDLKPSTVGEITWNDVKANEAQIPTTDFPVWVAPRKTASPTLSTAGESEKYLFYRGVANLEAPLRVTRDHETLNIKVNDASTCPIDDFSNLELWLVDVDANGELQYRRVNHDGGDAKPGQVIAKTAASFNQTPGNGLTNLREEMRKSLIERGLFADEAEAMLNTWEVSYFKTSGLRLFFTLPQSWTDRVLPMHVSGYDETEIVRTMIGRIELISDQQRELLRKIADGPVSDRRWFLIWESETDKAVRSRLNTLSDGSDLAELGLDPPADYQAYMELGRFRDALVHHEIAHPAQTHPEHVRVDGPLIQIRHPVMSDKIVDSFTIRLPGENRIINLGELEIYSGGKNIAANARITQSSNYQGRFPIENLTDGNKEEISHTAPETAPWIKVEFDEPRQIDEVKIWNRDHHGGQFRVRFNGAEVTFFHGEKSLATVTVRTVSANLASFARNYNLPHQW